MGCCQHTSVLHNEDKGGQCDQLAPQLIVSKDRTPCKYHLDTSVHYPLHPASWPCDILPHLLDNLEARGELHMRNKHTVSSAASFHMDNACCYSTALWRCCISCLTNVPEACTAGHAQSSIRGAWHKNRGLLLEAHLPCEEQNIERVEGDVGRPGSVIAPGHGRHQRGCSRPKHHDGGSGV